MDSSRLIVADVGGTNTRLGLARRTAVDWIIEDVLQTATTSDLAAAVQSYWVARGSPVLRGAAFCGAGPRQGQRIHLTNAATSIDAGVLAKTLGLARVTVLNDFEATAWSLPVLKTGDYRIIKPGRRMPGAAQLVIGPGTGFGAAAVIPGALGPVVLASEAGHARLALGPAAERAFWRQLERQCGELTIEKVLSGRGLSSLYHVSASISLEPAEVADAAWQGDGAATLAVKLFTRTLARVASDLALLFSARGGVFIAGGIIPRWGEKFSETLFCTEFTRSGVMHGLLEDTQVSIITTPFPALLGLASTWQGEQR